MNLLASASVIKYLIMICCHWGTCHASKTMAFNKSMVPNTFSDSSSLLILFFNLEIRLYKQNNIICTLIE